MTPKLIGDFIKHIRSKKGQGMIEYLFVMVLIVLAVIAALTPVGTTVANKFTEFAAIISGID